LPQIAKLISEVVFDSCFLVHDRHNNEKRIKTAARMLELSHISKNFGNQITLRDIDLKIFEGEFFSLLGPSGCGKTTLLRLLAGFEQPTEGRVFLNGQDISELPPSLRPFNLIFQKYALFPHMSVEDNVAFGLKMKKMRPSEISVKVNHMLQLMGLKDFARRRINTLSGGQSQRVAVARALVNQPKVLLLDEPLSALDLKMRQYLQMELKSLQRQLGLTFVFVTHDQDEAFALSDRVAVINEGRIEQVSSPQDLYERPQTRFVAEFIGQMNKLPERWLAPQTASQGECYIRPEKVYFRGSRELPTWIPARILQKIFRGDHDEWQVELGDQTRINLKTPVAGFNYNIGQAVEVGFDIKDIFRFKDLP
jgi:putative spermidine/putrescine transport system ATP-binding protein